MKRHLLLALALLGFVFTSSAEVVVFKHLARDSKGKFTSNTFGRHLSGTATVQIENHGDTLEMKIVARATSGEVWRTTSIYRFSGYGGTFHHSIPFHSPSVYSHHDWHSTGSGISASLRGANPHGFEATFRIDLGGGVLRITMNGSEFRDGHFSPVRFNYEED